jgi:diguanylate cyclase (GGDEF)-like protein
MDLDRFKNINDSLGHPVGDQLLESLAARFRHRLRDEDMLGRLGGDEFLIVLDHSQRPEDAANVAKDLIGLLDQPFKLPGQKDVYIGASIGISIFPQDAKDATQLVQHADAAMYQAKEQGRNTFRFYTPALTDAVNQRMDMESRVRRALSNEEFVLHYQPQVDSRSDTIVGCEALLRWDDPDSGLVAPADFIPLAEDTGLIIPLGDWVLRTACAQHKAWIDAGFTELSMAINLSARQLQQSNIVSRIAETIEQYGLPAGQVKLEITESMIMGHGEETAELLAAIKSLGVGLSIDDFGTGYSSLAYLKRFPIDELKIDRGFVRDIPDDENDAEIAATIIAMAHNLKLRVVAEGVETREQADFLSRHGCQHYQGYLFRPPISAADFGELLRSSVNGSSE